MSQALDLRSRIDAVTVFRSGAMVTRRAELPGAGANGPRRVQLIGLPLTLDDGSVRVELHSPGLVAGDLQITLALPGLDDALAPPTEEAVEEAALAVAVANAELDELRRAKARLEALEPIARGRPEEGKAPQASPTSARLELLRFRRERAAALAEQIAAARERLRELDETLASLHEHARRASSARNARANELRKAALIELHPREGTGVEPGEEAGAVAQIELHYFVPGARWAPSYTVRLDRSMREARLEMRALVGQATGEDWSGVELTLSTAHPQRWTELPELESRRIGRRQPAPAKTGWRKPPVGAETLYADYDRALAEAPEPEPMPPPKRPPPAAKPAPARAPAPTTTPPLPPMPPPQQAMPSRGGPPMPQRSRSNKRAAADDEGVVFAAPAAAAPVARKSGGLGSFVGGAIDGLASALSPDHALGIQASAGGGGGPGGGLDLHEASLVAGRELLDYGRLRMFAADDQRRGSLRRISLMLHYEQTIRETVELKLVLTQIKEARAWAALLDTEDAPKGHHWPHDDDGFDHAYRASAPVDLPSTGGFRSLAIDQREAEARPRYVSVPRETQDVFRIVGLDNPFDAPLLAGPIDVYVDGKFMLSSEVEQTPSTGKLELGIGVEQNIKIARNISFNEDSSGMFKRQLALSHTLALEVQNHLPVAALVEIRERIPVVYEAMADDISVELQAVEPGWEDYEPKRPGPKLEGGHRWKVEVPAKAKRTLSATYEIRLPANYELVGGNRRES